MSNAPESHAPVAQMELAPGVRLVVSKNPLGGAAAYELVDTRHGVRQVLSAAEYSVFALIKSGSTIEEVSKKSEAAKRLCERLIGAGLIRAVTPPAAFLPDDRPRIANGVTFARSKQQGIVLMTPPGGTNAYEMRDVEAIIAKSFDGAHTVLDIVEAARMKGVPATLQTMVSFLKQLHAMGCVESTAPGGLLDGEDFDLPVVRGAAEQATELTSRPAAVQQRVQRELVSRPSEPVHAPEPEPDLGPTAPVSEWPDARMEASEPSKKLDALRSLSLDKEPDRVTGSSRGEGSGGGSGKWLQIATMLVVIAGTGTVAYLLGTHRSGGRNEGPVAGRETPRGTSSIPDSSRGPAQIRVETLEAERLEGGGSVVAAGYIAARDPIQLGATMGGRVTKVFVQNGDLVKKDQVLVQIDDSQMRAEVGLAAARKRDADRSLERTRTLFASQAATQVDLDRAIGQQDIARAELGLASQRLQQAKVKSPISKATILDVMVRPGEVLAPSGAEDQGVVKLADLSNLVAEVDVSEGEVFKLRTGQVAEVVPDATSSRRYEGLVKEIAQEADRARGTVLVKVDLQVPDRSIRPGNSVKVTFRQGGTARLLLPRTAVTNDVVWVVANGLASSRRIAFRPAGPDMLEVTRGLKAGDRVVMEGGGSLKAGQKIE